MSRCIIAMACAALLLLAIVVVLAQGRVRDRERQTLVRTLPPLQSFVAETTERVDPVPMPPPSRALLSEARLEAALARIDELEAQVGALEAGFEPYGFVAIRAGSSKERQRGIRALLELARDDPVALEAIRERLADEDSKVRIEAIEALTELEDREALASFEDLLADEDPEVRSQVLGAFVELGARERAGAVVGLLEDVDDGVREDAAEALGDLESREAIGALVGTLADADESVRKEAIGALGKLEAREALPSLLQLYDSGRERGFRLLEVLRELGEPAPFEAEVGRLARVALEDADARERSRAVRTLGKRARIRSRDVLLRALEDPSARVRKAAGRVLR